MSEENKQISQPQPKAPNPQHSAPQPKKTHSRSNVSPFYLMAENYQYLNLLDYTKKFSPIPKYYFAFENSKNPVEQFHKFVEIVSWLLSDEIKLKNFKAPNLYDDPNTVATQILSDLKRAGLKMDISATSLRRSFGVVVCSVLHKLLLYVIKKRGHKFDKLAVYSDDIMYKEVDKDVGDEDEDEIIEEDNITHIYDSDDDDDNEEFIDAKFEKKNDNVSGGIKGNQVSVEDWMFELEQIAPQLVVRLNVDLKNWRTHVSSMSKQEKTISTLFLETTKSLMKIYEDILKVVDRIKARENMLNNDPQISQLLKELKEAKEKLRLIEQKYKIREEATIKLSDELNNINTELEDVKKRTEDKERELGDISKLTNIKEAIFKINEEIKEIDLRSGVLQHSVIQAKVKNHRIQSSKRNKFSI